MSVVDTFDLTTHACVTLPRDESVPGTQYVRVGAQNRFSRASYRVLVIPSLREVRVRPLHDDAYAKLDAANVARRLTQGESLGIPAEAWDPTRIDGQDALAVILYSVRDGFQCNRLGCVKRGQWQLLDANEEFEPGQNCICTAAATPLMYECNVEVMWEHRDSVWAVIVDGYASMTPREARSFATAMQEASQIAAVRNREEAKA